MFNRVSLGTVFSLYRNVSFLKEVYYSTVYNIMKEKMIKIENLTDKETLDLILNEVALANHCTTTVNKNGWIICTHCPYDGKKKRNESEQDYEDRIYTDAHNEVMKAVDVLENCGKYDMSSYDDGAGEAWYDCVREDALEIVCAWFAGKRGDEE